MSSSGPTLVSAPASAQQCTRALQEQGERGWWKAINNTHLNSQREEENCTLRGDFKAHALESVQGHFCERGHPVFTGVFQYMSCWKGITLDCIPDPSSSPPHLQGDGAVSTRNSTPILLLSHSGLKFIRREVWLHSHFWHCYQHLAPDI